jgi:heat shock protein HslJ
MKNTLLVLAIFAACSACKTKKKAVAAQQSIADTMYVENPKTGELSMIITTKNYSIDGDWLLQNIGGASNEEMARLSMTINAKQSQVSGNDACNQYSGKITKYNQSNIEFGPMASTKRACMVPARYAKPFYNTLPVVKSYKVTAKYLFLQDEKGKTIITFQRKEK